MPFKAISPYLQADQQEPELKAANAPVYSSPQEGKHHLHIYLHALTHGQVFPVKGVHGSVQMFQQNRNTRL